MNLIDLKSLIIGIASCALVLMLMGLSEGSNQKYQISCGANINSCLLLNIKTGISKVLILSNTNELRNDVKGYFIEVGEKPDF